MAERPVILEVALNGATRPEQNPAVPRLPKEIAEDAIACVDAGASVIHTHTHEQPASPAAAGALYLEAYEPVLETRPDAILYPTMGAGRDIVERYGHHEVLALAGAIRAGVVDTGSVNLGGIGADGLPGGFDYVYQNSLTAIRHEMAVCERHGLGPSIAVFEPGFLRVVLACHRAGVLPAGALVKFYFSQSGYVTGGEPAFSAPPIPEALDLYLAMLGDVDLPWAVAVLGGSLLDSPIASLALARGGHLRVGLEDHTQAKSNRDEVARARALCARHGCRLATTAEAEEILRLPGLAG